MSSTRRGGDKGKNPRQIRTKNVFGEKERQKLLFLGWKFRKETLNYEEVPLFLGVEWG